MKLYLKQMELGLLQNFVYLIGSPETREAVVVDPGWDVPLILQAAAKDEMKITKVVVTHTHLDHINGVEEVVQATDAQVIVHKKEAAELSMVQKSNLKEVEGEQEVTLGSLTLRFLHTPGHTPGSQCIQVADRLISGDTLFIGGCGRCDLPGGDAETMYNSLTRLSRLDDRLIVCPGHNYASEPVSTLETEKSRNPFLKAQGLDGFLNLVGADRKK